MILYVAVAVTVVVAAILILRRKKGEEEVPQGLQVLDANSKVIFTTTTNMTRFIERRSLWGSGTITLSSLGYSGTSLFVIMVSSPYYKAGYSNPPHIEISITSTSLTWKNLPSNSSAGNPAEVLLGVY